MMVEGNRAYENMLSTSGTRGEGLSDDVPSMSYANDTSFIDKIKNDPIR